MRFISPTTSHKAISPFAYRLPATVMVCGALVGLATFAAGCGNTRLAGTSVPQNYPIDGVKLISPSIHDQNAAQSMQQTRYALDADTRLLVRFESLSAHRQSVIVDPQNRMQLEIVVTDASQAGAAIALLHAYPLTRDWMMLATWDRAYPYASGAWTNAGGDVDTSYDFKALAGATAGALDFDVTEWFSDFVKGRNENFGLALIATGNVEVYGDATGAHAPRLIWQE